MWLDKVKEAKKQLGLSYRAISLKTEGKLSERDVMRLIAGDYKKPFVDDVIALGAALQLSPHQLFDDTNIIIESASTAAENSELKATNASLSAEVEMLKRELAHKEELLKLKDEILELYRVSAAK
jgi:hypothetical protein